MTTELETSGEEGPDPRKALEKPVLDNEDLARLEELTRQFNIFEAAVLRIHSRLSPSLRFGAPR